MIIIRLTFALLTLAYLTGCVPLFVGGFVGYEIAKSQTPSPPTYIVIKQ